MITLDKQCDFLTRICYAWDFPGGPVVKNPPSSAGDMGSIPGRGTKVPHAAGQLSPRITTTEPTRCGVCARQLERENLHATTREKPTRHNEEPGHQHERSCMPQRRSCVPQLRPDAAQIIIIIIINEINI